MKALELRIPPALVFLLFAGAMYLLARWLPVGQFDFFGRHGLMYALAGGGVVVLSVALVQFAIKRTTVDPMVPRNAGQLVTSGIYNYTRNPMYLSMLMFLLGWGLHLENAFNTLVAAGFVGFMNRFQILPEERALLDRFGTAYRQYCKLVRRWF